MPRKLYTPEEIIQHLRTVELETGKGSAVKGVPSLRLAGRSASPNKPTIGGKRSTEIGRAHV